MLAHATLFFAAIAAALTEDPISLRRRSALASMTIKESEEICAKDQQLVCCNHSKECNAVDIGGISESNFLLEHCTANVVCCDFESKNNIAWGDVTNNCIVAGQIA